MGFRHKLVVKSPSPTLETLEYTYRRVQVDKDGARNVFAAAGLSEESVVRTGIASILSSLCVNCSIGLETVLKEVTVCLALLLDLAQQLEIADGATEEEWR